MYSLSLPSYKKSSTFSQANLLTEGNHHSLGGYIHKVVDMFALMVMCCLLGFTTADEAKTCGEVLQKNSNAKSGVYDLKQGNGTVKAYCLMEEICGSRGWTMIMKIDGSKNTFRYNSPLWSTTAVYNVAGANGGLNTQETKLQTYTTMSFNKLCLGMKTGSETRWLPLRETAKSLYSLIADGKYRPTYYGRDAWKSLIKGSSLQRNCNMEGFNVNPTGQTRARIGIVSNQENDCRSPDSRLGFGTNGYWCRQNDKNSAGNEARCGPDNGHKSIVSFGYIFAQEKLENATSGSYDSPALSCDDILANIKDAKDGVYYLKKGDKAMKAYCYMGELCGSKGWTMIMKIDGSKTTFTYNSPYWSNDNGYNLAGANGGLDNQETKLQTYSTTPFNKLCLGMKTRGVTKWMTLGYSANSLHSLIADGKYRPTHNGREAWKSLILGSSLQLNCNQEGFNVHPSRNTWARIGIVGNNENDCRSPDSRLGFGTYGSACGQNFRNSAGNEARCRPDNGDRSTMSFGYIFAKKVPRSGPLGTFDNPASSCEQIRSNITDAKSGVYYLSKDGQAMFKAYCYMEEICGSRGWTMLMKIDGSKTTFHYNSPYWTNGASYNVAGANGGHDNTETKLQTYSTTPFDKLCLGFKRNGVTRWMTMEYKASSLHSVIADGKYRPTYYGREAWKSLIAGSSLQPHCNREGFNVLRMARIGIVSNQENDCNSPDSRLGLGTAGRRCRQNDRNSAGNEARCWADNGDKSIMVFGYIFAQEQSGETLLGSQDNPALSCTEIKAARSGAQSGVYYLKKGNSKIKAYCYMGEMCGSRTWTMIMKIDGSKTTFGYNSKYWTNEEAYNLAGADGGLDNQETKLQTYSKVPFNQLCLGFKSCGETKWMTLRYKANSLHHLIADGKYRQTQQGRDAWKKLIRGSSLQRSCSKEGFNVLKMARIGIVSSQDSNCGTPESRIGLGTAGSHCKQNGQNSAGNEARCYSDNGDQSIMSFGYIFAQAQSEEVPLGSFERPASSCAEISSDKREPGSGVYYLRRGEAVVKAYCYMEEICESRGWTLIMKIDGNKNTFHYNSPYWTNTEAYNMAGADGDLDNTETKLQTYSTVPFDKMCLGLKTGSETRWMKLDYKASSLHSVIADGKYRATRNGRDAWKKLINGSSLQRNCNREGFNVLNMARIGIVSDQENDCRSPDSRIGFGTAGSSCGQNDKNSAGNEARCSPDNGNKSIKSFGYIFVQEK